MPICPRSVSSSFPAWPTKGRPCLSSWKPGASPTKSRSAAGLPAPKTTCVRPAARRQRVHAAAASPYARSSSTCSTWTALTTGNLRRAADGDDACLPRPAWRLDDDLVALGTAEDGSPDGRFRRDAADRGELHGHALAVLALELDQ